MKSQPKSQRGRSRPLLSLLLTVSMVLPILTWDLTLAASAATISNYDLEMVVTYQGGGRPNSAVGEAQPDAPSPSDPDLAAGPEVSTEFLFSLSCGLGVCTGQDTPQVTWDFGDGTRRVGGMLEGHRYKKPGIYTARASATKGTWHGEVMRTVFVSPRWADVINVRGYDEVVSNDSPVLYWRLGETSSLEAALDRSGNGNSGTYGGDPVMGIAGAIASGENTAVRLGDGDSVTATSPLSFSGNPSLTVEAWVRPEGSISGDQEVLRLSSIEEDGALVWYRTAGGLRVEIGPDSVTVPLLEDWNHVMVGWTAGIVGQVFVNGTLAGAVQDGALNLDGGFTIGGGFTGSLDEVAVFDGPLGAARAAAHAAAGADDRIAEARSDRESLWVVGALELFDSCRTATEDDGAEGLELGRPMYCPEPRPTTALSAHLTANGPIVVPQQLNSSAALVTAHGVTGEDCLSWWGACNLPKQFFDGPTLETTETVDVAGLEAAGKITSSGELIYDPLNCGDGWAMRRNVGGAFELVRGSEDGCVTKAAWYESLVRAVDGHLAKRPGSTTTRLAAVASTCQDDAPGMAGSTYSMRRAVSLGLIDTDQAERPDHLGTQNGPGFYCDPSSAISKAEAYRSLAWALGVTGSGGCPEGLRDLYDMSLGQDQVRAESPDCGLFAGGQERGVPYVGDLVCHWGGVGEGICVNGGDPLFRAAAATLVSGVITEEGRGTGELVLDLSQDGPKPVGTVLTVTAVGRAPLTTFGDFTFSFPAGPPGTNRLCGGGLGVVVVPTAEVSGERRATATCGYVFSAEEEASLQVTLTDINANVASSSITVSGVNEAPLAPSPSAMATVGEGALSEAVTTFTSTDLNGQAVTFEISRNELNPFSGPTGPSGPYAGAIAADSPLGFWRLAETSGGVLDNSGNGYNGTATGGVTRNQSGALVGDLSTSYQFDGTGAVEIPGVPAAVGGKTTVELWVRWDGGTGDQVLVAWEDGQWLGFFDGFLGIADGPAFEAEGEGLVRGTPVTGMVGRWNHIVAEFDPVLGESALHLNGVRQNLEPILHRVYEGATSSGTGGPGLVLGDAPAGGSGFSGRIDEVAVYHGTLNSTRMRIHHELGRRRVIAADADGRDMVTLELTAVTSNTARVTARPLTGDVNGTYSFLIRSYDGEKWSEATEVQGVVGAANDAPVVSAGVVSNTAYEDGPDVFPVLYGADPNDFGWSEYEGGVTIYRITAGPAAGNLFYDSDAGAGTTWTLYEGGTVDTNNPTLRYTPPPGPFGNGYWGITYQVLDEGYPTPALWSVAREAQIFVANTNDPPVCIDVLEGTSEDTPKEIDFLCADPDEDSLSYEVVDDPANAALSGTGSSRLFTPNPDWCGDTSYTYRAFDGELYSATQTVHVSVTCVNDAPTAPTGSVPAFNEDSSGGGTFHTTDVDDGPEWTFEVSADGSNGWSSTQAEGTTTGGNPNGSFTVVVTQGSLIDKQASITVTPDANVCGDYTFYIRAFDGDTASAPTQVDGDITCVNDAPTTPTPATMTTVNEDSPATTAFSTTDVDGGPNWTFEVSSNGTSGWSSNSVGISGGTVAVNQGVLANHDASITFTPSANWCGGYTFYVRVYDGAAYSSVRTATGTINCVNDAPSTPTISSVWGSRVEESPTASHWTRTYSTADPDSSGQSGGNRWCLQFREGGSGNWQPGNTSGNYTCPTSLSNYTFTLSAGKGTVSIQQGSLTDKSGVTVVSTSPNFVGTISMSTRFCDDGGLCSASHTQTLTVTHYHDHLLLTDVASGNFRWRQSIPLGNSSLQRSEQWGSYSAGFQPISGDWDHDGTDDYAKLQKSDWRFYNYQGSALPNYWAFQVPSASGSGRQGNQVRAFAGDWDGDGDDDYALWSNVAGRTWLVDNDTGAGVCFGNGSTPAGTQWTTGCSTAEAGSNFQQGMSPAGGDATGNGRDDVFLFDVRTTNIGMWTVRNSVNGGRVVSDFWFGPSCGYTSTESSYWYEHCFAVVGDWDANGIETPGLFLREAIGSHPTNRFFWSNNFAGGLAGQADYPAGSVSSTYLGVQGFDRP